MMDWLAKALDLPKCFIHDGKGPGAGVIQSDLTMLLDSNAQTTIILRLI